MDESQRQYYINLLDSQHDASKQIMQFANPLYKHFGICGYSYVLFYENGERSRNLRYKRIAYIKTNMLMFAHYES